MSSDPRPDRFFVGYLAMPAGLGGRVLVFAVLGMLLALASAYVWISTARAPGSGSWDTAQTVDLVGYVAADPYPVLKGVTWNGEDLGTVLLVSEGKIGAQDRLGDTVGGPGIATGYLIRRGELAMLELVGGLDAVRPHEGQGIERPPADPPTQISEITLRGEIVDPKCYLGVMQPGDGRTHKACAALCILGGIPPMFQVTEPSGAEYVYLLLGPDGEALPRGDVSDLAGEPVIAAGKLVKSGGLATFQVRLENVRPTGPRPIALNSSN